MFLVLVLNILVDKGRAAFKSMRVSLHLVEGSRWWEEAASHAITVCLGSCQCEQSQTERFIQPSYSLCLHSAASSSTNLFTFFVHHRLAVNNKTHSTSTISSIASNSSCSFILFSLLAEFVACECLTVYNISGLQLSSSTGWREAERIFFTNNKELRLREGGEGEASSRQRVFYMCLIVARYSMKHIVKTASEPRKH